MANGLFQPLETYQDYATRTTGERNALLRQQQQMQQADQAFQWEQQDRAAAQQAAQTKAQQAAAEWGVNAVGVLAPLKDRPEDFNRAADVFAAEAAQRGIPLRREEITPETVAALEAQLRIRGGMAPPEPPKRDVREVGGSLVDLTDGQANVLYTAPEKPQQPQQYAPQFSTITGADGQIYRYNERTGQVAPLGINAPAKAPASQATRKEFNNLQSVKDFQAALPVLVSARKMPDTGAGDIGLIYSVGKVLDPNSVVREGELALALKSDGLLAQVIGTTRLNLGKGGRLPPETRQRLLDMLNERVMAYRQAYDRDFQQYGQYAQEMGLDPTAVTGRHATTAYVETPKPPQGGKQAPAEAVAYLRQNPQYKAAFRAKYGYLPDGM